MTRVKDDFNLNVSPSDKNLRQNLQVMFKDQVIRDHEEFKVPVFQEVKDNRTIQEHRDDLDAALGEYGRKAREITGSKVAPKK